MFNLTRQLTFIFLFCAVGTALASQLQGSSKPSSRTNESRDLAPAWCSNPPRGQCNFYADCVESLYHCGPDGHPIGYGQKYCNKFTDSITTFSPKGQKWVFDTMECLQVTLANHSAEFQALASSPMAATTCKVIEDTAFDSHSKCYIDSGLCSLPWTDWFAIIRVVDIKTLFSSFDAFKETLQTAGGCAAFLLFLKGL